MRRIIHFHLIVQCLLLIGCATQTSVAPAGSARTRSLARELESATLHEPFRNALWGVRVEDESGRVLYEKNAHTLMMPASNRKLFVAALANFCLGPSATLDTEIWMNGTIDEHVLHGDLIVKGSGDPSLGGRYEFDRDAVFLDVLDALRSRGVDRIDGSVVADVSRFSRETIPGSWKNDNLGESYAAPVDALTYNENVVGVLTRVRECSSGAATTDPPFVSSVVQVTCGSDETIHEAADAKNRVMINAHVNPATLPTERQDVIAIADPALYAAQALNAVLDRRGITVIGSPRVVTTRHPWDELLATLESPPLYELLAIVLKNSQNLYAESLFRDSVGGDLPVTYHDARSLERQFLTREVGIDPLEFHFEDGSGLSPEDMVTPAALVRMIRYLDTPPRATLFRTLFATPGEEGTLRRRLPDLKGRIYAKTGSIQGVNTLTGYVMNATGGKRYFSIMLTNHLGEGSQAIRLIDTMVRRIARF